MQVQQQSVWGERSSAGPAVAAVDYTTVVGWVGSGNGEMNYAFAGAQPSPGFEPGPPPGFGEDPEAPRLTRSSDLSRFGPALAEAPDGFVAAYVGEAHGGINLTYLAVNTGSQEQAVLGFQRSTSLPTATCTTAAAPGLAYTFVGEPYFNWPASLWVAWQGMDAHQTVNVAGVAPDSSGSNGATQQFVAAPRRLWSQAGTAGGPALCWTPWDDTLYLAYAATGTGQLVLVTIPEPETSILAGTTDDITTLPGVKVTELEAWSGSSPALSVFGDGVAIAWTGTDAGHTLNADVVATGTGLKAGGHVLGQSCFGSPALAVRNNWGDATPEQDDLVVAWSGTDSGHSLNVALLGTAPTKNLPPVAPH